MVTTLVDIKGLQKGHGQKVTFLQCASKVIQLKAESPMTVQDAEQMRDKYPSTKSLDAGEMCDQVVIAQTGLEILFSQGPLFLSYNTICT